MSTCETCRWSRGPSDIDDPGLTCARIQARPEYPTAQHPATLDAEDGRDVYLRVLPTFGCKLWSEP